MMTPPDPARGPRPLPAYLALTLAQGVGAVAAFDGAHHGDLPWHPSLAQQAAKLNRAINKAGATKVGAALARLAERRLADFLAGIAAYQAHPYRRRMPEPPVAATCGSARLLDYGGDRDAPVLLLVPSLVNPSWVLDLAPDNSLIGYLRHQGVRVLLLDWGAPLAAEHGLDLSLYVETRLLPLIDRAAADLGPVVLAGYCLGGDLALAAALLRPDAVRGLALLATPWDFHAEGPEQARLVGEFSAALDPVMTALGRLPADAINLLFAALDPGLAPRKFRDFATLDPQSPAARDFVALEDWANAGPALTAPAARQCFREFYRDNLPGRGAWRVAGRVMSPAEFPHPALHVIAARDRIVPPASSRALAAALPGEVLEPEAGHVGMVVGSQAERLLWRPLSDWIMARR